MSQSMPAFFLADSLGLDFLNSVATPIDTPVDWIDDGEGFLRWLEQAQLVPADVLAAMRARAMTDEVDLVAAKARNLREWFRGFVREHKGMPLQQTDLVALEPLNRWLERDEGFDRIVAQEHGSSLRFSLQRSRRWSTPETLLLPVVDAMARLVCEEDFSHVKACEGPACTLLFADHTRGHVRRWCSMAQCGNRAKQAAHRQRTKAGQANTH
jgi:predicted RNA-binding Zn ribbon-like protein